MQRLQRTRAPSSASLRTLAPRPAATRRRAARCVPASAVADAPAPAASAGGVKPRIAIACGDPSGIGPEVCLKALSDPS
ncbi:hypothetical protein MNEG_15150, partial [Monoraphidium neglectum]